MEDGAEVEFFLEFDRSTEPLDRIAAKMPGYEELEHAFGRWRWVLFSFDSSRREAGARAALAGTTALMATYLKPGEWTAAARGDLGASQSRRSSVLPRRTENRTMCRASSDFSPRSSAADADHAADGGSG